MKYGVNNVFDLQVYTKDGLAFSIDTVVKTVLHKNFETGEARFVVEDALVDAVLVNDILSGKYDGEYLRIKGQSTFRDLNHVDKPVELHITVAKLNKYILPLIHEQVATVCLEFNFPLRDAYGFANAGLIVK